MKVNFFKSCMTVGDDMCCYHETCYWAFIQ